MTPRLFAQHEAEAGVGRGDVRREDGARLPGFDAIDLPEPPTIKPEAAAEAVSDVPTSAQAHSNKVEQRGKVSPLFDPGT